MFFPGHPVHGGGKVFTVCAAKTSFVDRPPAAGRGLAENSTTSAAVLGNPSPPRNCRLQQTRRKHGVK